MKRIGLVICVLIGAAAGVHGQTPRLVTYMVGGVVTPLASTATSGQLAYVPVAFLAKCMNGSLVVDCNFSSGGSYNPAAVAITGGTIDNTVIGGTTPAAGSFTTLLSSGLTGLGGASNAANRVTIPTGAVTTGGSGFGLRVASPTGGANNFAGLFDDLRLGGSIPSAISTNSGGAIFIADTVLPNNNNTINFGQSGLAFATLWASTAVNSPSYVTPIATVATATTIAPTSSVINLTGTTAIATITTPAGYSSTIGGCITFTPASTVATTIAGNIAAVYSLIGGKSYQGCWNGTSWFFIGSGI